LFIFNLKNVIAKSIKKVLIKKFVAKRTACLTV